MAAASKIILGIETSCDDTGIAFLKVSEAKISSNFEVLANEISSQIEIHRQYGGVFPAMAKREHSRNIVPLFVVAATKAKLLKKKKKPLPLTKSTTSKLAKILEREPEILELISEVAATYEKPKIDMLAVTTGPGLEPTLWVGISFARALALIWDIPVVPTNHMEGHVLSVAIPEEAKFKLTDKSFAFPMLSLLVSGGHTELVVTKDIGKYSVIGSTRDDAAGEAFDKVARMLDLPYPGGPEISKLAHEGRTTLAFSEFSLPRPMLHSGDFDFSFSGLKTAVLYTIRDLGTTLSESRKKDLAREFEEAVVEVLVVKTLKAAQKYGAKTITVGGGVAANQLLRQELMRRGHDRNASVSIHFPTKKLSTDNALMIALAGYLKSKRTKKYPRTLKAEGGLKL
jgi:N6-L-threonylcarbamoyladenine synthase